MKFKHSLALTGLCALLLVSSTQAATPNPACQIARQGDSHVLSLTWHPAFCQSRPNLEECAVTDPNAYQAGHFILHGLWPNKSGCGIDYGFCGEVKQTVNPFCNYPKIELSDAERKSLGEVMPGMGSCLDRHEWWKHGSCAPYTPTEYFTLAGRWVYLVDG